MKKPNEGTKMMGEPISLVVIMDPYNRTIDVDEMEL